MVDAASDWDILTDVYHKGQIELRAILQDICQDAMKADTTELLAIHLKGPEVSQFSLRTCERQGV